MSHIDPIDRVPTAFERWLGVVAALLIFIALSVAVGFAAYWLWTRPEQSSTTVVLVLICLMAVALWALRMAVRFIRGRPRRPSYCAQLATGIVAAAFGSVYTIGTGYAAVRAGTALPPLWLPLGGGAVCGIVWARHAWSRLRAGDA